MFFHVHDSNIREKIMSHLIYKILPPKGFGNWKGCVYRVFGLTREHATLPR